MNQRRVWIHIAMWAGFYILWVTLFQNRAFTFSRTITVGFCYLLFVMSNYYFNLYYTIPQFLYRKKYVVFALLLLTGILISAVLRVPVVMYLARHYFTTVKTQQTFDSIFIDSFVNIFIWVIFFLAGKLIIDRIRFQKYVDTIEKEKSKTELDFLKAQFNPHFLFNSINSIYGHIDKGNSTARHMLLTFSEMLRYQLYDCNTEYISIDKEINYIKNYVALQRVRKEEGLIVNFDVHENVKGFTIVPLLFIAFIENAFKYVSNNENTDNKVEISFFKTGETLVFKAFNTVEPNYKNNIKHSGIGIANVKRRLELLYPQRHKLDIKECEETYEVTLELQQA